MLLIQLGFTYLPASQSLFDLADMKPVHWAVATLFALMIVCIVELEKALQRRYFPHARVLTTAAAKES